MTTIYVDAAGAQGSGGNNVYVCNNGPTPPYGKGGRVQAWITVTPGETLNIYVGSQAGYNGGGLGRTASTSVNTSGNGGGEDIRQGGTALTSRVIVAGGGGGGADGINGIGGSGGGTGDMGAGGNASGVGAPGTQGGGGAGGFG